MTHPKVGRAVGAWREGGKMVAAGGPSPGTREGLAPTVGGDHPDGGDGPIKPIGAREWLAEERRLPPYPWLLYSTHPPGSNPSVIPPRPRVWSINTRGARVSNKLIFSRQINGHLIRIFPSPRIPLPSLIPVRQLGHSPMGNPWPLPPCHLERARG